MPIVHRRRQSVPVIGWTTITYRSVITTIFCIGLLALVAFYFTFPQQSRAEIDIAGNFLQKVLDKWFPSASSAAASDKEEQQANFTALEGSVRVKKHNRNTWSDA